MLINWFTVVAQIVNFLILVFLLKYFLYDRVIRAMDQREQRIQQRLQEAEEKKQEAEQEAEAYGKVERYLTIPCSWCENTKDLQKELV